MRGQAKADPADRHWAPLLRFKLEARTGNDGDGDDVDEEDDAELEAADAALEADGFDDIEMADDTGRTDAQEAAKRQEEERAKLTEKLQNAEERAKNKLKNTDPRIKAIHRTADNSRNTGDLFELMQRYEMGRKGTGEDANESGDASGGLELKYEVLPMDQFLELGAGLEGLLRDYSNVLQQLHHSFNTYVMTSLDTHVSSGIYYYPVKAILASLVIFLIIVPKNSPFQQVKQAHSIVQSTAQICILFIVHLGLNTMISTGLPQHAAGILHFVPADHANWKPTLRLRLILACILGRRGRWRGNGQCSR